MTRLAPPRRPSPKGLCGGLALLRFPTCPLRRAAPRFSSGSLSSNSLAMVTPSSHDGDSPFLLNQHRLRLGPQRDADSVRKLGRTAQDLLPGGGPEENALVCHVANPLSGHTCDDWVSCADAEHRSGADPIMQSSGRSLQQPLTIEEPCDARLVETEQDADLKVFVACRLFGHFAVASAYRYAMIAATSSAEKSIWGISLCRETMPSLSSASSSRGA